MIEDTVINQWSNALFQLVVEVKKVKEYSHEAGLLIDLFEKYPEFLAIANSYTLPMSEKETMIRNTFKGFSPYLINIFLLLIEKRYFNYVKLILKEFRRECNAYYGIQYGIVYSVVKLSPEQMAAIEKKINKLTKNFKVEMVNKIDESLIGGIKIKVKNDVFDGSVKGKLEQLRTTLLKTKQEE